MNNRKWALDSIHYMLAEKGICHSYNKRDGCIYDEDGDDITEVLLTIYGYLHNALDNAEAKYYYLKEQQRRIKVQNIVCWGVVIGTNLAGVILSLFI